MIPLNAPRLWHTRLRYALSVLACLSAFVFLAGCKGSKPTGSTHPTSSPKAELPAPKPFAAGRTAFVRVKQYTTKTSNPAGSKTAKTKPTPSGVSFSFGDTVTLLAREDGPPVMWTITRGLVKTKVPEYLLTTSKEEIDFLSKAGRVPETMAYVYMKDGHMDVWGSERVNYGFMIATVDSEGMALLAFSSGTSPFALKDNAVIFDEALAHTSLESPPVFDAAKKPFPLSSTVMYYCVSGEDKPAFEAIDLRTLTISTSAP
jgi:hypothetical protein